MWRKGTTPGLIFKKLFLAKSIALFIMLLVRRKSSWIIKRKQHRRLACVPTARMTFGRRQVSGATSAGICLTGENILKTKLRWEKTFGWGACLRQYIPTLFQLVFWPRGIRVEQERWHDARRAGRFVRLNAIVAGPVCRRVVPDDGARDGREPRRKTDDAGRDSTSSAQFF